MLELAAIQRQLITIGRGRTLELLEKVYPAPRLAGA